ncbi:MAG: hypothetical protein SFV21_05775 [Rhodospirillaceae bacterium]|nr:hypothetical protein [Rhodospirillaceae bacterium]
MAEPQIKLPRQSKGKRPYFFDDPAIDQMMTFIIELTAEVSVVYDRLDTVERLLATKGTVSREEIESYRAPDAVEAERMARRDAYLKRVFRMHPPQATYAKGKIAAPAKSAPAKTATASAPAKKPAAKKPVKKPSKSGPTKSSSKKAGRRSRT